MLKPRFGLNVVGRDAELNKLLDNVKSLDSIQAQIVLRDAYDTSYGIYDHSNENPNRPMALVGMHPAENTTYHSRLYNAIRRYKIYDVKTHFGLSLTEFLELPREYTTFILGLLAEGKQAETNRQQKMLNEIENLGNR